MALHRKQPLAVVIMAAGKGTRMKDPTKAKVMFEIDGKPLIHFVIELAQRLHAQRIISIVGFQRETVEGYVRSAFPSVEIAVQAEQKGTGHAVIQTEKHLRSFNGHVLVLSGDVPLLTEQTMLSLIHHHDDEGANATILTADFENPAGYGRVIRNADGSVKRIVEHKDATAEELAITEINSGIYIFERDLLFDALGHVSPHNVQNEYYLPDVFEYYWKHGKKVLAVKGDMKEIHGINTVEQLEEARQILSARKPIGGVS